MDILTKVKTDHANIHALLQELIVKAREGSRINILLEDLLEEVKEHMQAEKVCLSEMLIEDQKQENHLPTQIDRETLSRLLSEKIYQSFGKFYENKELEDKLCILAQFLQEHSCYIEDVISLLSQECISDQKSEELSVKFEQEKVKTLIRGITYA